MKQRSAVVIAEDNVLILIERVRSGKTYYLFPGGGIESGETPEQAAVREAREELGLDVALGPLIADVSHEGSRQFYFLATVLGGHFGSGDGPEMGSDAESDEGSYRPVRLALHQLHLFDIRPKALAEVLRSADGLDGSETLILED
jgi:8-oxo-dGTP pyrophosphatase MutT (NUDIX family)